MMKRSIAYIGTYTRPMAHVHGKGKGIYTVELCNESGTLSLRGQPIAAPNSSYLCQSQDGTRLYSINEIYDYQGDDEGSLNCFSIEAGCLSKLQECGSCGMGPAYICIDRTGRWLFSANYVHGNVVTFPRLADGTLGPATQCIQLAGSGPDLSRQEGPHPHAILPSPDNRFVYVVDLGADHIRSYQFDAASGTLTHLPHLDLAVAAGSGPRHLIFHPSGNWAYFVSELSNTITSCRVDSETGTIELIGTSSTLPEGNARQSHCSELCLSADGNYLYVANRGHDSIAIFTACSVTGALDALTYHDCGGHIPRHIALSPNDQYLLVANQETNALVVYPRNPTNGLLGAEASRLSIPTPAYIEFST